MTRTLYDLDIPYVLECNLMALMSEHFQNHLSVLDDRLPVCTLHCISHDLSLPQGWTDPELFRDLSLFRDFSK